MDDSEYASKPPDHQSGQARRDGFWANRLAFVTGFDDAFKWVNWAARVADVRPAGRKVVLMLLANHADEHGRCWPKISTLAKEGGLALNTVKDALRALRRDGLIESKRRRGASVYQLTPFRDSPVIGLSDPDSPMADGPKIGPSDSPLTGLQKCPGNNPSVHPRRCDTVSSSRELSPAAMAYKQASNGD